MSNPIPEVPRFRTLGLLTLGDELLLTSASFALPEPAYAAAHEPAPSRYLDRNSVLWPGSVVRLRQGLRQVRLAEYRVEPVRARRGAAGSTTAPTRG